MILDLWFHRYHYPFTQRAYALDHVVLLLQAQDEVQYVFRVFSVAVRHQLII